MIVKSVKVELDAHYFNWLMAARGETDTRSEVIMVLPRPNGRVLTLTKSFYPTGTYNLPSGGIQPGETPEQAFLREVAEETGLHVSSASADRSNRPPLRLRRSKPRFHQPRHARERVFRTDTS